MIFGLFITSLEAACMRDFNCSVFSTLSGGFFGEREDDLRGRFCPFLATCTPVQSFMTDFVNKFTAYVIFNINLRT